MRSTRPKVALRREDLTQRTARIYEAVPDTDGKAYSEARTALQDNEELTFSTREIDLALREIREAPSCPGRLPP